MQVDFLMSFIVAVLSFIVATVGSYYSRNSFLLDLKILEKDKKRPEKAKHYHDKYINVPPSFTPDPFLKQIDSDELNETVKLPFKFTDFLIKNYPDRYFYFVSLLKKSWSYFDVIEIEKELKIICTIQNIISKKIKYFSLYITFAMISTTLVLYNDIIINKIVVSSGLGTLVILCFFIILSIILTFHFLYKLSQMAEIEILINQLEIKAPE